MRFQDLDSWLRWQEALHPEEIDLGLDRVAAAYARLASPPAATRVVTVAGTNGKGSCVAVMEAVLLAAGHRVVAYTSPHLQRYNERIRVDGVPVADEALLEAFARVDEARHGLRLTYFEFGTLAALDIVARTAPDLALLEVGLGGRLDAVNVVDPDAAVVTTVGLDHQAWLGGDRERIGAEKAGIFRAGVPVVLGESDPPDSVLQRARALGCPVTRLGQDFRAAREGADAWRFEGSRRTVTGLSGSALRGRLRDNAAAGIEALDRLPGGRRIADRAIRAGARSVRVPGRLQHLEGPVEWIIDLAHNAPAAAALAGYAGSLPAAGRTWAVIGLYADKDATAIVGEVAPVIDRWVCVDTPGSRGRLAAELAAIVEAAGGCVDATADRPAAAIARIREQATEGDRVLVFGSFSIVGPALTVLECGAAGAPP